MNPLKVFSILNQKCTILNRKETGSEFG